MIGNDVTARWADLSQGLPDWPVGGKAMGLFSLISQGVPVPPTWVLAPDYVDALCAGGWHAAPSRLLEQLWDRLTGQHVTSLAVRSSASIEDQLGRSHAGQFRTVLDVTSIPALLDAVRVVRRSLDAHASRAAQMAVILQPFVRSLFSGVLFSVDPVTGDRLHYVIEYSSEHPSAVVDGRDARRLLFNRATRRFVHDEAVTSLLPAFEALVDTVERFQGRYQTPIDVEWCWASRAEAFLPHRLCILQCRPAYVPVRPATGLAPGLSVLDRITSIVSGQGRVQ